MPYSNVGVLQGWIHGPITDLAPETVENDVDAMWRTSYKVPVPPKPSTRNLKPRKDAEGVAS